jgi:hypothetical protein
VNRAVIDTNVLLVANGQHLNASNDCVLECINRLVNIQKNGITVLDSGYQILNEYSQKTSVNPPKGVGDVFLKHLYRQSANKMRVELVTLTQTSPDFFNEFPDCNLQATFDAPDRKFVATSNAHPRKPAILQAVDCKWLDWWPALHKGGIVVDFLCAEDICQYYQNKFPEKTIPDLPRSEIKLPKA